MKAKFQVTELSHEDLVNLFSTALYGNNALYTDWEDKYNELKDKGEGDCFEDHLANILLNGGEIMISDLNADGGDDFYNNDKSIKTSTQHITLCSWKGEQEYDVPTYHITLQDIYKGMSIEGASKYVQELFIDENGDLYTAWNLLQFVMYGEEVWD